MKNNTLIKEVKYTLIIAFICLIIYLVIEDNTGNLKSKIIRDPQKEVTK